MTQRKTNEEFIADLMAFSRRGALMQIFVIQALRSYSVDVVDAGPVACHSPLISGEAWVDCAKEALEKLEKQYNSFATS